eukprot:3432557-Alexandrium_andersonii.AAC.1
MPISAKYTRSFARSAPSPEYSALILRTQFLQSARQKGQRSSRMPIKHSSHTQRVHVVFPSVRGLIAGFAGV